MTAWSQPSLRAILPVCQLSEIPIKGMAKHSARTGTTLPGLASPCLCVSLTQIASSAFIILLNKIHCCKPPRNDGIHPSPVTGSSPAAHCLPITGCSPVTGCSPAGHRLPITGCSPIPTPTPYPSLVPCPFLHPAQLSRSRLL